MDPVTLTKLYDRNALWYDYPIADLMERAGEGIADQLIDLYGNDQSIGIICGPGNNGGDGLVAARYLHEAGVEVTVYLVPAADQLKTDLARQNRDRYTGPKHESISAGDIAKRHDILVECLFGTGIEGELRPPYGAIVTAINSHKAEKVTVDLPTPGCSYNQAISLMVAKTDDAHLVDIGYPDDLRHKVGIGEIKLLTRPGETSHKGTNGKVLIVGGSEQYHGAPLLAAEVASRFTDLVYFSSTTTNNAFVQKMKSSFNDRIIIDQDKLLDIVPTVDALLIGPGMEQNEQNRKLVNTLLTTTDQPVVLDAGALSLADPTALTQNTILTPHKQEFQQAFGLEATDTNCKTTAQEFTCTIVRKGPIDLVAAPDQRKTNETGNEGMTKGGTGDLLAGLTCALAATNDPFHAACAAVFLNGLAGDQLYKKQATAYNADDLIQQIPKSYHWALQRKGK